MRTSTSFFVAILLILIAASGCKKKEPEPDLCPEWVSPANGTTIHSGDSVLVVLYYSANIKPGFDSVFVDFFALNTRRDMGELAIGDRNNYDSLYVVLHNATNITDTVGISLNVGTPNASSDCATFITIYLQP